MSAPPLTYEEELRRNLSLSRTILHHTSRRRLLLSRSYTAALRATLSLTRSIPYFHRSATQARHIAAIAMLDASLRLARARAYKKTLSLPIAQDVYAMLCHFLGLSELDKGDVEVAWMADAQRLNKGSLLKERGEKRWFGTSVSFAEKRQAKEGHNALTPTGIFPAAGDGRNSLRVDLEKEVDGEGWNRARSASCVGEHFSM